MKDIKLTVMIALAILLVSIVSLPFRHTTVDDGTEEYESISDPSILSTSSVSDSEVDRVPMMYENGSRLERSYNSLNTSQLPFDLEGIRPVRVDSDDEFRDLAEDQEWPGNGSSYAPFIIENYAINGADEGYSIYIGNVTYNFRVQNCYLHNAEGNSRLYFRDSGIYLYNTTNGVIKNNTITNNRYGIYIQKSWNNTVNGNTIMGNIGPGIFLLDAENNTISENSIQDSEEIVENEDSKINSVLVKFKSSKIPENINQNSKESFLRNELIGLNNHLEFSVDRVFTFINGGRLNLDKGVDPETAVKVLSNHPLVEYAELDRTVQLMNEPNDPGYGSLWGMQIIDAPGAWEVTTGSEEIVIAVIDTGIDYTHPDLKANMWEDHNGSHGYNFVNDSFYPMDDHGHGTHVAGTIGAVGNNNLGVVGVNWNVSLMSLKFIDETGRGTISDAIASLEYVLERKREGTNVVATSNSWGGASESRLLMEAIEKHRDEGILFVAAAGNSNRDIEENPSYPASYELTNIISVGATSKEDNRTSFSNYGANSVHVGAPGERINSTAPDNTYMYSSGTSMAAPHVSGLAALISAKDGAYDYNHIKNMIISSVDRLDSLEDKTLTSGRINASKTLTRTPDDEINLWIHAPGNRSQRDVFRESNVMVSLNDGIYPILGANISVKFSTGEDPIYLEDDGIGCDQVEDDGYYSGKWYPEVHGDVELTFIARVEDWEKEKTVNVTIGKEAGLSLRDSHHNNIAENNLTDNPYGMRLYSSNRNTLKGNHIFGNRYGLLIERSNYTELIQNKIEDVFDGLLLIQSHHSFVSSNEFSKNIYGTFAYGGRNHTFKSNRFIDNYVGLLVSASNNIYLEENNLSENVYGIDLFFSHNCTIIENKGFNNTIFLSIWSSQDNILKNNIGTKNDIGISLINSLNSGLKQNNLDNSGVMISGNELKYWNSHSIDTTNTVKSDPIYYWADRKGGTVPSGAGQIILVNCTEISVKGQTIHNASIGITLAFSDYNTLSNNTVSNNLIGIYSFLSDNNEILSNIALRNEINGIRVYGSNHTLLLGNYISDSSYAIAILNSRRNTLKFNNMVNAGIMLDGIELEYWNTHLIDADNLVNGAPVYYWSNKTEGTVPFDAGQIILANCTGVTIKDQNFSKIGDAITMGFSNNNILDNVSLYNNSWGIYLRDSNHNLLKNINSVDNTQSITLFYSNKNHISYSTFLNDSYGLILVESKSNVIFINEFIGCNRGVSLLFNSRKNTIYHNNFFESEFGPGRDTGHENRWYKGYPEGGNYWTEHESKDLYSGPGQNKSGSDGIADDPYEGNGFIDQYPLIEPYTHMEINIKYPENDTYLNSHSQIVRWNSEGGIGKREHRIRVEGGEWVDVGNLTKYELTGLSNGRNLIYVEVFDNAGQKQNDTVFFTVDNIKPLIEINEPRINSVINTDEVVVRWDGKNQISSIDYYEIRINGGEWIRLGHESEYDFEGLKNGRHVVEVRAVDIAGNIAVEEVTFYVFYYNPYLFLTLLIMTSVLLSYGVWNVFKTPKSDIKNLKVSLDEYNQIYGYDSFKYKRYR